MGHPPEHRWVTAAFAMHRPHSCCQERRGAAGWHTALRALHPPRLSCCAHHRPVPQFLPLCKTSSISHLVDEEPLQSTLSGIFFWFFFFLRKLNISFLFLRLVAKCSDSTGRDLRLQSPASGAGRRIAFGSHLLLCFGSFPVQILKRSHPGHTVAWPWWSSCQQREPEGSCTRCT